MATSLDGMSLIMHANMTSCYLALREGFVDDNPVNLNKVYMHPMFLGFHFLYKKCDIKNVPFFTLVFFSLEVKNTWGKNCSFC